MREIDAMQDTNHERLKNGLGSSNQTLQAIVQCEPDEELSKNWSDDDAPLLPPKAAKKHKRKCSKAHMEVGSERQACQSRKRKKTNTPAVSAATCNPSSSRPSSTPVESVEAPVGAEESTTTTEYRSQPGGEELIMNCLH